MTKRDIVVSAALKSNLTQDVVQASLEAALTTILEALSEGKEITLNSFGAFLIRERKGRISRHPSTGERLVIEPKKVVKFKITPSHRVK